MNDEQRLSLRAGAGRAGGRRDQADRGGPGPAASTSSESLALPARRLLGPAGPDFARLCIIATARPPDHRRAGYIRDFQTFPPLVSRSAAGDRAAAAGDRATAKCLSSATFSLSLELGDNLFQRGNYQRGPQALLGGPDFANDQAAVEIRLGRCRPFLPPPPPPPVIVVRPPPPVVVVTGRCPCVPPVVVIPPPTVCRPRLVVFTFLLNCARAWCPPHLLGDWAADHLCSYFGGAYEIIDRGEVCWYMGRLGSRCATS